MSYAIFDVDLARPRPRLTIGEAQTGFAVLLRRSGRPIDFWMEQAPAGSQLSPEDLERTIAARLAARGLDGDDRDAAVPPADSGFPSLTVAICTKDRPDRLGRCLVSLRKMATAELSPPRILVVDNAPSDDSTRRAVAAIDGARYVCEQKPGLDFARNRAIESCDTELLAFLDDDVTVDRMWLAGLAAGWAADPQAGAFTGLVLPLELSTPAQIIFERRGGFRRGFETIRYGASMPGSRIYPCNTFIFGTGANMAFRTDTLRRLGGFDEALDTGSPLPGGGDLDIFYRVIRGGERLVYEPRLLVFHEHRPEIEALRRQYWSWGLSVMAYVVKSYRSDPAGRPRLRRFTIWWFGKQTWQLVKSLAGNHAVPLGMLLAELRGGVVGLCGEYPRSIRRVERIRREFG